jgi:phenylalanyl-tRNA synthetase beta chain
MHIALKWLQRYLPELRQSPEQIEESLILLGFEVESVSRKGLPELPGVVVGEVLTRETHPNADKLSVCTVNTGDPEHPAGIVCGAKNFKVGDRVPVALPGAVLPGGFTIQAAKLRGVDSAGMMCSARELGLGDDHGGLLILESRPEIGTPINAVFPGEEVIFDVEVTPNRPDSLSHIGIARELAAHYGLELRLPEVHCKAADAAANAQDALLEGVCIEARESCLWYTAHSIRGVRITESPAWLKDALTSIGLRPINNVVDVTNFVLHECGQPMHAFDASKIQGRKLIVRKAQDGESLATLDGKTRKLRSHDTVIADEGRALAIAGIMGGLEAEVDENTVDVVLESAFFERRQVRRSSRELGLSTDSSYRFERGVDPAAMLTAARRAVDLILETAGGTLASQVIEQGACSWKPQSIRLTPAYIRERCGFGPDDAQIRRMLQSLHLDVQDDPENPQQWLVQIPSFRGDLERPIDLVEEFLRLHGTDKIPETEVQGVALLRDHAKEWQLRKTSAALLSARGFHECYHYTLVDPAHFDKDSSRLDCLKLLNPISSDQTHLRPSLIPGLIEAIRVNLSHGNTSGRFFEWGRVHLPHGKGFVECLGIAFALHEPGSDPAWLKRPPLDFYQVKALVNDLLGLTGQSLPDSHFKLDASSAYAQQGHFASCAFLSQAGFQVECGMIDLRYLKAQGIEGKVWAGCIALLPATVERSVKPPRYQPFSHLPPSYKDLALVADETEPAVAIQQALVKASKALPDKNLTVSAVQLFDVYRGQGLESGKKSLAFTLTFRSSQGTPTDEAVNQAFEAIQAAVEKRSPYRVRR